MVSTYFCLRLVLAAIAILFPLILWKSADWFGQQDSISDYYHTPMRDFVVGMLVAIGVCLYAYKGFTKFENIALNFAGILVICVAWIPTTAPGVATTSAGVVHNVCAVSFFILISIVCLTAKDNGRTAPNRFKNSYRLIAVLMILLPLIAAGLAYWLESPAVFWVEFAAILVFGLYWILQTLDFWLGTGGGSRADGGAEGL